MSEAAVPSIYLKLLEFQKQHLAVKKAGKNPAFKSSYATLNDVLDAVKGPLNDLGVLMLPLPQSDGLTLTLIATDDGSQVTGFLPYVALNDPQKLGGNNTYNERYLLVTMLGLEQEDDDGNAASKPAASPAPPAKTAVQRAVERTFDTNAGDGPTGFTVAAIKKGTSEKTGKPWELLLFEDGTKGFNNSGMALEVGRPYAGYFDEKGSLLSLDGQEPF